MRKWIEKFVMRRARTVSRILLVLVLLVSIGMAAVHTVKATETWGLQRSMMDATENQPGLPEDDRIGSLYVNLTIFRVKFDEASRLLNLSQAAFERGDYEESRRLADDAANLFDETKRMVEEFTDRIAHLIDEIEEKAGMVVTEETIGEMDIAADEDGNVVVTTTNHVVKLSGELPKVQYEAQGGGAMLLFTSELAALIEFSDQNGDGEIQENEILRILPFSELAWAVTSRVVSVDDYSVAEVTYRYVGDDHDVAIVMRTYQSPTLQVFMVGDQIYSYFVEGNAKEVKFDLIIGAWPWSSESSSLALTMELQTDESGTFKERSVGEDENWLSFETDELAMRVKWINKARLIKENGVEEVTEVEVSAPDEGDTDELLVTFIYPNFVGKVLEHDPTIGLGAPLPYLPILSIVSTAGGSALLSAVILVIARYRTKKEELTEY